MLDWRLALRFARRELRGGFAGFRIFFFCLLLGSAAIAGVESLSDAFLTGLQDQGQVLLGGDVSVNLVHRAAGDDELKFLNAQGRVSRALSMRAMAYARDNTARQLVELKGVDDRWPLFGAPKLRPAQYLRDALACEDDGVCGVAAEQTLLDRLHVKRGDLIKLGDATFRIMAALDGEPDRISTGFSLGPRLLVAAKSLAATGLVTPESLVNYTYRIALTGAPADPVQAKARIAQFRNTAQARFPEAGWNIRDRGDAAPGIKRFVEQLTMFLTLVGLVALGVGGVGAGQAILAFLDRKRADIAILKTLGASGGFVFLVFFLQVMAVALLATVVGAALGAMLPFAAVWIYGSALPVPPSFGLYPVPLLLALAFGLLSAVAFAVPPLSRARAVPPASLFRDVIEPAKVEGQNLYRAISAAAALGVAALTLLVAPSPVFAAEFLVGAAASLALLRLLAEGLRRAIKAMPRPKSPLVRLAFANLVRPGAATGGVVTALGLGLTLLATVTLLNSTINAQVAGALPARAPSFFFVDIQPGEAAAFDRTVTGFSSASGFKRTPMIRGRITALNGVPSADAKVAPEAKWALSGDRGITYAATPPEGTIITEGKWWAADYRGPTLISLDQAIAKGTRLKIGDSMTLNVLGRSFQGRIGNLRKVDFTTGGQNFVLVLSPGLIDQAPHAFLATVRVDDRQENALYMAVTNRFPNISTVRVKDAIQQVQALLASLAQGVSAASLVTILAGLLVLAGAIAAGTRARLYDATILKVLGATRARIALVYAIEYGVLGLATGVIALLAGTLAGWVIAFAILDVPFTFDARAVLVTVVGGAAATLLFGLLGALGALSVRPARRLRSA
ncbi:MAG: FtsX-like permease family protein [Alphaproteobacteria bacterium]|nr:FtsX-like permease family protein [Alphaproteobacteria bacterium]